MSLILTVFETTSFWVVAFLFVWLAAQFILAPILGRFCKYGEKFETNHLPPLPQGSILGKPQNEAF